MNKSLFCVVLLFPAALVAMEQNQPDESKKPAQNELLSLVDACTKCMSRIDLNENEQERYLNAHRTTMEKLLRAGSLGNTAITIKVIESMPGNIIGEYEDRLKAFFETQIDDVKCAIIARLSPNGDYTTWMDDPHISSRVKCALIERVPALQTVEIIENVAKQGQLTIETVDTFFDLLRIDTKHVRLISLDSLLSILKGELFSVESRKQGNAALMSSYLQKYFNKRLKVFKIPIKKIDATNIEALSVINMYFERSCIIFIDYALRELNRINEDLAPDFIMNYPKNCVNFNFIEQWLERQDLQQCKDIVGELLWIKNGSRHLDVPIAPQIIAMFKEQMPVEYQSSFFGYIQLKLDELNANPNLPEEYKKIVEGLQEFFTWLFDNIKQ